jgi:hypothetical protein
MSNTRTYRHNDGWMTEVTADKFSSYSRPSDEAEIAAALAAEARAERVAAYAAKLAEGADAEPDKAAKKAK